MVEYIKIAVFFSIGVYIYERIDIAFALIFLLSLIMVLTVVSVFKHKFNTKILVMMTALVMGTVLCNAQVSENAHDLYKYEGRYVTAVGRVCEIPQDSEEANSMISGLPIEGDSYLKRVSGGVMADGFNSFLAGVFNSFPNSIFAQNNGIIQLTGVASRYVGYYIAAMLVLLGLFPIVGAVFSLMPDPVLGGATLLMFRLPLPAERPE